MQKDYYKREKRDYFFIPVLLRYNQHKALYKFKMPSKITCVTSGYIHHEMMITSLMILHLIEIQNKLEKVLLV